MLIFLDVCVMSAPKINPKVVALHLQLDYTYNLINVLFKIVRGVQLNDTLFTGFLKLFTTGLTVWYLLISTFFADLPSESNKEIRY